MGGLAGASSIGRSKTDAHMANRSIPRPAGHVWLTLTFPPPDIIVKMAYFMGIRAFFVHPPGIG